jgi:hypothetical protein
MSNEKLAIEQQAENDAIWLRFFTRHRYFISESNKGLLIEYCDKHLLPFSLESFETAFNAIRGQLHDGSPAAQKASYSARSKAMGVESTPEDLAAEAEAAEALNSVRLASLTSKPAEVPQPAAITPTTLSASVETGLPKEWTPSKLSSAPRNLYRELYQKYGRDAINDRLAGRS